MTTNIANYLCRAGFEPVVVACSVIGPTVAHVPSDAIVTDLGKLSVALSIGGLVGGFHVIRLDPVFSTLSHMNLASRIAVAASGSRSRAVTKCDSLQHGLQELNEGGFHQ
jgi:hypothetical protein